MKKEKNIHAVALGKKGGQKTKKKGKKYYSKIGRKGAKKRWMTPIHPPLSTE